MSDVITSQIQKWRQEALAGTITLDDMRLAITAIRKERVLASGVSATARAKKAASKVPVNQAALLAELENL